MIQEGGQEGVKVAVEVIQNFTAGTFPEALASVPGTEAYRAAWDEMIDAAEDYNDPGNFTAFIGYEWTSTTKGFNLHRVVIYRDGASKASMMDALHDRCALRQPDDPVDLWKWLQILRGQDRREHPRHRAQRQSEQRHHVPDRRLIHRQARNDRPTPRPARAGNPVRDTQIKGDGETHPFLSPNDEFADYETWDQGNLDLTAI